MFSISDDNAVGVRCLGKFYYLCFALCITHPEKLEAFESLAGDHGDELHFAEEGDLWRCQTSW